MEQPPIAVSNAGLSILSPWFPRLFALLGLLNDKKSDFNDEDSRIRAVFILQYAVACEERKYNENELAFNRLLVNLPSHTTLPCSFELREEEKNMVNNLLESVKIVWSKLKNTSVISFQQSFILRNGNLEQQEKGWILNVERRVFDILMDSIPWSYSFIRFPWIEKTIEVRWPNR